MKHLKKGRKFSRTKDQREAMMKIMLGNLLSRGKMQTTEAKAKELRSYIDKIITQGKKLATAEKKDSIATMRLICAKMPRNIDMKKLQEIAVRNADRKGGYTRVVKTGVRRSDSAKLAIIELL